MRLTNLNYFLHFFKAFNQLFEIELLVFVLNPWDIITPYRA